MRNKIFILFVFLLFIFLNIPIQNALGHGLGLDSTSIDVNGKEVLVTVEIPQYSDLEVDKVIKITTVDKKTKENVKNVTLLIGLFHEGQMIFRNYFFTQTGDLTINIKPSFEEKLEISGEKNEVLDAWYATESTPIEIYDPIFNLGGLFHFEIEIRTIDEPTNIIENLQTFVADVSIIETTSHMQKTKDLDEILFQTKSYFDRISNFQYDFKNNQITLEIPFDWSEKTISHVPVVHEEIHFPKDFVDFLSPSYIGQVNGIDLFKSSVTLDDYSYEDQRIVHFVLLQDHLKFLKNELKRSGDEMPNYMRFTLVPSQSVEFPMTAYTRDERFQIDLSWDPIVIEPQKNIKFIFTIRDGSSGEPLRLSSYDFIIIQNAKVVYQKSGSATIGGGFEEFMFTDTQTGPTVIRFENIRGTDSKTEFGLVVVPEFGELGVSILVISLLVVLIFNKKFSSKIILTNICKNIYEKNS